VFGWNYDTIDGTGIRDYIDVNDLVYGHILAYKKIEEKNKEWYCDVFNIWTWKWISVLEAIKAIDNKVGKSINYSIVERRNWDIPVSFCDTTKIEKELWFKAIIPIEESVLNSWKFYNK
jgi:UDP-glucose 4-epimerase